MTHPTITPPPTAPSRTNPTTFRSRMDAFLAWFSGFATEVGAVATWIDGAASAVSDNAGTADTKAGEAAQSASDAAQSVSDASGFADASEASSQAAAAAAGASPWVSAAAYTAGDAVWSAVNSQTYRAVTAHSGVTTDPSADGTNWVRLGGTLTNSELLAKIKTVDGANSGLDADLLDGKQASGFSQASVAETVSAVKTFSKAPVFSDTSGPSAEVTGAAVGWSTGSYSYSSSGSASIGFTAKCNAEYAITAGSVARTISAINVPNAAGNPPVYVGTVKVVTTGTGSTIAWPASVRWAGGSAPPLTENGTDIFTFVTYDKGVTWYGIVSGQAMA